MTSLFFSGLMAAWLVVTLVLVGPIFGQEGDYIPPQGTADAPPPQLNVQPQFNHFGGNHEAFLASLQAQQLIADQPLYQGAPLQDGQNQYSGRSAYQDQQLVTKVFVKPDGGIATIQIPQQFHYTR